MEAKRKLRIWYVSNQRLAELFDQGRTPPPLESLLRAPRSQSNNNAIALMVAPKLMEYLETNVPSLHGLAASSSVVPGACFTLQARFRSSGLAARRNSQTVSLRSAVDGVLEGRELHVAFGKDGLANSTAYTRLSGQPNCFVFCSISEVTDTEVLAVPYVVADLVQEGNYFEVPFSDSVQVRPESIGQFRGVDFSSRVTREDLDLLREVPEVEVKRILAEMIGEADPPADWGGEENDLFTSNLQIDGKKLNAAFLLKGPAVFREMMPADCGKRGDQIYRLFRAPADVFVLQHCHRVSPAVRRTMEAYSVSIFDRLARYMILDGYDTVRILRANGRI